MTIISYAKSCVGLLTRLLDIRGNKVPVFTFHRVVDLSFTDSLDRTLILSPAQFEIIITYISSKFNVVGLEYLLSGNSITKRCCVITFDDGWADNFTNAFPLLKKLGLTATIFITTSLIGSSKRIWFDQLSDIIHHVYSFPEKRLRFCRLLDCPGLIRADKASLYCEIATSLKKHHADKIAELLEALRCEFALDIRCDRSFLTWEELKEMSSSGISFGSHCINHSILTSLSSFEQKKEIFESKEILVNSGVRYVDCISFPNGEFNQDILDLAEAAGYRIAFYASTKKKWPGYSPILSGRISITSQTATDPGMFHYVLFVAGLRGALLDAGVLGRI